MRRILTASLLFCALLISASRSASAVTIPTVLVGNPNNANDSTGFGAVAYNYHIGTTEVTNAQYVEFLNATDASGANSLALYSSSMTSDARGGINFGAGNLVGFKYSVRTDMGNKPVNFVSWYDSIRMANWLHNGQGSGGTETGAYTLGNLGAGGVPTGGMSINRNAGATWFIPSENEWYKAAYHQPAAQGGDTNDYWLYPTANNSAPTMATAINTVGPTRGDIGNPAANVANYNFGADWNSLDGNVTTVGSAGPLSESYYGTSDQGGNVLEWNERKFTATTRSLRGGAWDIPSTTLASSHDNADAVPMLENRHFGFRLAAIPEPSTLALAALGLVGLGWRAWRQKTRA